MCRKIAEGLVKLILVVHGDNVLVSRRKEACDKLHHPLRKIFLTENFGELKWYLGCTVERDSQQCSVTINQLAMIEQVFHATQHVHNHFFYGGQRESQNNGGESP